MAKGYEYVKEKSREKSNIKIGKGNIISLIALIIIELLYYYFKHPPINIYMTKFWVWVAITLVLVYICAIGIDYKAIPKKIDKIKLDRKSKKIYIIYAAIGIIAVMIIMMVISSPLFMSSNYAALIDIHDGNFSEDIVESEDISDIALMDTDSARIIGDRAIGSLSDVVSQFEVSQNYSTIDYNGKPMKVAPLVYADFFKWMNNKSEGIPGYVLVDTVKNEAQYVELENPIKYSPSGYLGDNLSRKIQFKYPTYEFNGYNFELDNEGNPFYICPVIKPNAGLYGAKDVVGVVIFDPCSGDSEYYEVGEVPNWVDRVYDGDLAIKKYDWYGNLSGGFINSIIGNKGCKVTTEDYGYKVIDGDVYVYTGVTSVNGDQSNIGFVLINLRTGESKYFAIAGAAEFSAMDSAEGQVQHLGYQASFPSLININDIPTYIMVMKDDAGLVKLYAMVNVEKYSIVATGATQKEALTNYNKLLVDSNIITNENVVTEDMPSKRITVSDIKYITTGDETNVYITDKNGDVYKQNFADNEQLIFIQVNDIITVYYNESEDGINDLNMFEE